MQHTKQENNHNNRPTPLNARNTPFEMMIPVAEKDADNLKICLENVAENINPQKIIIVANRNVRDKIQQMKGVEFVDEDELLTGLNLENIKNMMNNITGTTNRSGWYFQQFLKMAYAYKSNYEHYLIWDADTIPLRKISFFTEDGHILFTLNKEFHIPYFKTIDKLFRGEVVKLARGSFIAEHMMINRNCMIELLSEIEANTTLKGTSFYEKIMYAIDVEDIAGSGFSEFETYGNYILKYYPSLYKERKIVKYRGGAMYLDKDMINRKTIDWVAGEFDTISFEDHTYDSWLAVFRKYFGFIARNRLMPFKLYRATGKVFKFIYNRFN